MTGRPCPGRCRGSGARRWSVRCVLSSRSGMEAARALVARRRRCFPAPTQAIAAAWQHLTAVGACAARRHEPAGASSPASRSAPSSASRSASPPAGIVGLGRIVRPVVDLLRPIPPLAWIPIAIVWFGLGEPSKLFVIFLGAFFPVFTNACRGMISIPPVLLARGADDGCRRRRRCSSRLRCRRRCPTSRRGCASASVSRSASSSPPS